MQTADDTYVATLAKSDICVLHNFTKPLMKLFDPCLSCKLDGRIKKYNLILYAYLMNNRLQSEISLEMLLNE